ncbi:hypothetical protein BG58_15490 [Caballeronia jiangsuensis]|nr:hypothetical protein BG58_15490 [Caballeronia jiangsuensis]
MTLFSKSDDAIERGSLLRFAAGYPFEDRVVMMVCEAPDQSGQLGLIAISGYKAGINCYVVFPSEASTDCLSARWLIENWQHWVWPDGDVNDVEVCAPLEALDI